MTHIYCSGITSTGSKCRKSIKLTTSDKSIEWYCHHHLKQVLTKSMKEIKAIKKERDSLIATTDLLMDENSELKKELMELKSKARVKQSSYIPKKDDSKETIARLQRQLEEANKCIAKMQDDYDRYQIIKQYESMHHQYESAKVSFSDRDSLYHNLRLTRNLVAHPVMSR
jgi:predicted RNase H-like nuclease (RuvC/YqgF family)